MQKSVLITGCSSGIGLCVARGLAQRNYQVFATARKSSDVEKLAKEGLTALQLDVRDTGSIEKAVNSVLEQTGGTLYALFNNGAYGQPGAVEDLSREVLEQQFNTNVFGWHELTRQILPIMRKQGYGRIIQNSSILGFITLKYRGAYNASKYALEGLSDTLRLELRGTNIFISLVEPGPIVSDFRKNAQYHFEQNIDAENSAHREHYQNWEARFKEEGPVQPFTLPAEAVLKRVIHALESPRPKSRYPVTFPTYLFAVLKRILPTSSLDYLLNKIN